MSRLQTGGFVPLFEKLGQAISGLEGFETNYLSIRGVEQSIFKELRRIVSTRSRLSFDAFLDRELSVIDYGLPDFFGFSIQNLDHRNLVKQALKKSIEKFEPRLTNLEISCWQKDHSKTSLFFEISGVILFEENLKKTTFFWAKNTHFLRP